MNLGTPAEPSRAGVRAFLKEFLSDPRVVEVPRLIWIVILYLFILTFRTPRVTRAYQKIWSSEGSPLRVIVESQAVQLQKLLADDPRHEGVIVRHAMTYSGPSLAEVVAELEAEAVDHILVLPLYPQFSATTTGSIYDQVGRLNSQRRNIPQLHIIKQYYDHPLYIEALANSVKDSWQANGKPTQLLMSFHGIPERYTDEGDPYYQQSKATAVLLAKKLDLDDSQWRISFQSRLGFAKWLSPYTSEVLKQWGEEKLDSVAVICPAFSADCLETLEEIAVENRALYESRGGENFSVIACLNDKPDHIQMMAAIVDQYLPDDQYLPASD